MIVSSVHEHVHERARQNRQPDQKPEDVGAMLSQQQQAGDPGEDEANARVSGHALLRMALIVGLVWQSHERKSSIRGIEALSTQLEVRLLCTEST
jgi:hypothetical protein